MKHLLRRMAFRQFKKHEASLHELSYLFWECTTRCNLSCKHCGSDCSKNSYCKDMPLNDFLTALDTIEKIPESFTVVLTGGEPLLRKDIELCGREIRKRGMRWSMVTNGYLYSREKHISLLNAGLGALTVSLDGLKESHNWLRNNSSSFDRVDAAIELAASSSRINFDVVTCVNKKNFHELEQIKKYLTGKGVKAWRLFTIIPIGRAKNDPDMFLDSWEFEALMDFIRQARKDSKVDVKFSCEGFVGKYEWKVRDGGFFCRAGINIGSVLADGAIAACPNIDKSFAQGNIYKDNFFEIWKTKYQPFRDRSWTRTGQCENCKSYKDCQGNGFHNWHGEKNNVLVCHKEKLKTTSR
jgi:radical SAM enzyme (rSAM/lipoprotein system)